MNSLKTIQLNSPMAKRTTKRTPKAAPKKDYDIKEVISIMKKGQKKSILTVKTDHKGVNYHLLLNGKHQKLEDADYQKIMQHSEINEVVRFVGEVHGVTPPATRSTIEYSFRPEPKIEMPGNEERV